MKKAMPGGLAPFLAVYLMIQLSGCTLIGMGLGSLWDNASPKESKKLSGADIAADSPCHEHPGVC